MKFRLDPPSGYADSYFDIEFLITLDPPVEKATIKVHNDTSGEQLLWHDGNYDKNNLTIVTVCPH